MMRKLLLFLIPLLLFSFQSDAQFKKLIKRAKEKAIEAVIGEDADSNQASDAQPAANSPEQNPSDGSVQQDASQQNADKGQTNNTTETEKSKPVVFPVTGEKVTAMHAVFAPVIDGDIKKIAATPEGKYYFTIARQKGLKGTDVDIFRQLMKPKNTELAEEISNEVEKKYPQPKKKDAQPEYGRTGVSENFNPAWGGFSAPSLYFEVMTGEYDVWMTNRYIKWASRHEHTTMADAFGVNVIAITDLLKGMTYSIGSVLGVNYTMVKSLDTVNRPYGPLAIMPLIKSNYPGIEGIKIEEGKPEKFGKFNCSVVKITIPVRPYIEPGTHKPSNSLLYIHDVLSNRSDASANNGKGHWDPSYKIIYKGYFSHDIEKYLPDNIREMVRHLKWEKGIGVGGAVADEKGNSADFRLIDITTDNRIDNGQFQIPEGYPVMTQAELNEAIKKQFSLKDLFKKALKNNQSPDKN